MRKFWSKTWHISTRRYNIISIRNSFPPYTYRVQWARTSYVGLIFLLRLTLPPIMEYFLQPQKPNLREILLNLFPRTNEIILTIRRKDCFCQMWRKLVTIATPKARTQICIFNVSNNHSKEVLGTRICAFVMVTGAVSYRDGHLTIQVTFSKLIRFVFSRPKISLDGSNIDQNHYQQQKLWRSWILLRSRGELKTVRLLYVSIRE